MYPHESPGPQGPQVRKSQGLIEAHGLGGVVGAEHRLVYLRPTGQQRLHQGGADASALPTGLHQDILHIQNGRAVAYSA